MYKINRVTTCKIPLDGYIDYNAFKLYFLDVGLLAAKNNLNIQTILEGNKIFTEYKGSLTEQYVLGEIKFNYNVPINYWSNDAYKTKYNVRASIADYKENEWITNIPLYLIRNIEKII